MESLLNRTTWDVPYSNLFILGSCSEVSPVGAKADTSDIQVTIPIDRFVLQAGDYVSTLNIINLGTSVTTSGNKFPILTEPYAAYNTVVLKSMD